MNIHDVFNKNISTPSDINEHLITLNRLANEDDVNIVTEFGMRTGNSTSAFLASNVEKVISYDISYSEIADSFKNILSNSDTEFIFKLQSTIDKNLKIEPTDILFIDSLHTYNQLSQELSQHGNKSRKYIIFHDTMTFGSVGEDRKYPGLNKAINEFLENNNNWTLYKRYKNNNGLTILIKK